MTIHIEALTFNAIIGLLDFEREHTQRVIIDLEALYPFEEGLFIDYADLTEIITQTIKKGHYELLEDALLELETVILAAYPQISSLYLKITKPDILSHCNVALSHKWEYAHKS
jgi:dihydroneopterin aldolase